MRKGRYYLGRVVKYGRMDNEKLLNAILNSPIVEIGKFDWTFTDVVDGRADKIPFVFGKLSKYAKNGQVKIVDEASKSQKNRDASNLLEASSPFVYLPQYSGLAFLHVWNGIQEDTFARRFQTIVESAYDKFFVTCEVEPITDYKAFVAKLALIDKFTEITAKVFPPNPLFGRLWGSLNEYVKRRKASDVFVKETSVNPSGINTDLVNLLNNIMQNPAYNPPREPDITDAAILMAADGYGKGKVIGYEGQVEVIIRTADTQRSFLFHKDPVVHDLVKITNSQFSEISQERNMDH